MAALCVLFAVVYIPTHLFAGEKALDAAEFEVSRPLDRFRLWWFKMLIGVLVVVAIGIVLYTVITVLCLFYDVEELHRAYRAKTVRQTINAALIYFGISTLWSVAALIYFGISTLWSVLLRRQVAAFVCVLLTVSMLWSAEPVNKYLFSLPGRLENFLDFYIYDSFRSSLVIWPALLFGSLVIFARGSLWKRSKSRLALLYSILAVIAFVPTLIGITHTFPRVTRIFKPDTASIRILDTSANGSRMLLKLSPSEDLVSVDLPGRRVNLVERGRRVTGSLSYRAGDGIIYTKSLGGQRTHYFCRFFVSDFEGNRKRKLFSTARVKLSGYSHYWTSPHWSSLWPKESPDGSYLALAWSPPEDSGGNVHVIIADSKGEMVGRYDFKPLEGGRLVPIGWDNRSRFYFSKATSKAEGYHMATYMITPGQRDPEQAEFLPREALGARHMSPDGRWMQFKKHVSEAGVYGDGLYNIASGEFRLVSEYAKRFIWSNDSRVIAFLEREWNDPPRYRTLKVGEHRLVAFEPETGKRSSVHFEKSQEIILADWSQSSEHLLFSIKKSRDEAGKKIPPRQQRWEPFVFSADSGQIINVRPPNAEWKSSYGDTSSLGWAGNRLVWAIENLLITTEFDGSKPKEIFRIEGNEFAFSGEGIH